MATENTEIEELDTTVDIPEGATVNAVIEICSFTGPNGEAAYQYRADTDGDTNLSSLLGLLMMASVDIRNDFLQEHEGGDGPER